MVFHSNLGRPPSVTDWAEHHWPSYWPLYSDLAVLRPIARSLDCNTPIWRRSGHGPIWPWNSLQLMTSPNKQYQSGRDRASPDRHNLQSGCGPPPIGLIALFALARSA